MRYKILVANWLLAPYRVNWLNELGKSHDVTILYLEESNNEREQKWLDSRPENCKCVLMKGITLPKIGKISFDFMKYWKKGNYDFVILDGYGFTTQIFNIFYLNAKKIPYFVNVDGMVPKENENKLVYKFKKSIISRFPYCLCGCKATNKMLCHYGSSEEKIINHPFTSLYEEDIMQKVPKKSQKEKMKEKLGIKEKKAVISVGRFTYLNGYGKGYDMLLKSAKEMPEDIGWYIVGGKPTEEFAKMTEDMGLKNVHYVDFIDKEELKEYYIASDLFVLMTVGDVWGLVINEAMSCGLPIITTDKCMAGVDLIENGENGYIVPVGDDKALTKRATQILFDEELCDKMSVNALEAIRPYTIENIGRIHIENFDKIIG